MRYLLLFFAITTASAQDISWNAPLTENWKDLSTFVIIPPAKGGVAVYSDPASKKVSTTLFTSRTGKIIQRRTVTAAGACEKPGEFYEVAINLAGRGWVRVSDVLTVSPGSISAHTVQVNGITLKVGFMNNRMWLDGGGNCVTAWSMFFYDQNQLYLVDKGALVYGDYGQVTALDDDLFLSFSSGMGEVSTTSDGIMITMKFSVYGGNMMLRIEMAGDHLRFNTVDDEAVDVTSTHGPAEEEMQIGSEGLFMGFSADGKAAAFETTWRESGTEADGKQRVYVVDVDKNDWVTSPIAVPKGSVTKDIATKYGIVEKNYGELVLGIQAETPFDVAGKSCKLKLIESPAPDGKNKIFELDIICGSQVQVLQKDKALPKSRGEVDAYELNVAYVKGNRIAVLMRYKSAAFEGNDGTTRRIGAMLVTGSVK